jgi:hypothetical protein
MSSLALVFAPPRKGGGIFYTRLTRKQNFFVSLLRPTIEPC